MYDLEDIIRLRKDVRKYKLSVPAGFSGEHSKNLVKICNGIGPEAWPKAVRRWFSLYFDFAEAPAMIHDWEYSVPRKSFFRFVLANFRFAVNVMRTQLFSLWTAVFLFFALTFFGYRHYRR